MQRALVRSLMPYHARHPRYGAVNRIGKDSEVAGASEARCKRLRKRCNEVGAFEKKSARKEMRNAKRVIRLRAKSVHDAVQMPAGRSIHCDADAAVRHKIAWHKRPLFRKADKRMPPVNEKHVPGPHQQHVVKRGRQLFAAMPEQPEIKYARAKTIKRIVLQIFGYFSNVVGS